MHRLMNPRARAVLAQARRALVDAHIPSAPRKYHQTAAFYNGERYDSQGEARYAQQLDVLKAAGKIRDWSRPAALILLDGPTPRSRITYKPDFRVEYPDGRVAYYDYKGSKVTMTQAWRLKSKLWNQTQEHQLRVVLSSGEEHVVATGRQRAYYG